MPRLSIIVATYNSAATLRRCLESIFSQDFTDWEALVVDGGSCDGTVDIITAFSEKLHYWHSRADRGIYDAWNQALKQARGEYVCFIGADDAWTSKHSLSTLFEAIGGREIDLVTSRGTLRDMDWRPVASIGGGWNYARLPRRLGLIHPGLLHRRTLFDTYGPFDDRLRIVGDLDFLLRLPANVRVLHVNENTIDIQAGGISRRQFWRRLSERYHVHTRCARVGRLRAGIYWADKAWRMPIARMLGLPY